MNRRMEITGNVLSELLNYMAAAAAAAVLFQDFMNQWPGMGRIAALAVIPVFYYVLREFCQNPFLFFVLHILPVAGVIAWWGRNPYEKAVMGGIAVLFALLSIGRRLSREKKSAEAAAPFAVIGVFCLLYFVDSVQGFGKSGDLLIQMLTVYLIGYFLQLYFINFLRYMDMSRKTMDNIPEGRAFGISFGLAAGFTGAVAVLFYGGTHRQQIDEIGARLGRAIAGFLGFLFSLLPEGKEEEAVPGWQIEKAGGVALPEAQEASFLARILDVLLFVIAMAVTLALVIGGAIVFYRLIREAFLKRQTGQKADTGGEKDKVESLLGSRKKEKRAERKGLFHARTPQEEIRRIYYKTMYRRYRALREEKTRKLIKTGSARECCLAIFPEGEEEAEAFVRMYEKARYANDTCTSRELKQMKRCSAVLTGRRKE